MRFLEMKKDDMIALALYVLHCCQAVTIYTGHVQPHAHMPSHTSKHNNTSKGLALEITVH